MNITQDKNPLIPVSRWDDTKWTILHGAAYFGHLSIIKWYKEMLNYSNINLEDGEGNTPLSLAIQEEKLDIVEYLIDHGYGLNVTSKNSNLSFLYRKDIFKRCSIEKGRKMEVFVFFPNFLHLFQKKKSFMLSIMVTWNY